MSYDKEKEFKRWLEESFIPPMTRTQHEFASMLFNEENYNIMSRWGDLDIIYKSIRKHLKP